VTIRRRETSRWRRPTRSSAGTGGEYGNADLLQFAIVLDLADANVVPLRKAATRLVTRAANEADAPRADVSMLAGTLAVLPSVPDRERCAAPRSFAA
jgi:hypothetical protein